MCTWNCQEGNSTADRVFHTFFIMGLFCVLQRILWEIWPVTRKNEHFPKGPSYKDIGHLGSLYPEFPRTKKLDWRYNLGIRSLSISFFAFLSIICINCTILYSESVFLLICCQNLPDAPFSPGTPPSSFLTCDYPHWGAVAEVCSSAHSGHHSRAGSCHPPVVHTSGSAAKRAPSTEHHGGAYGHWHAPGFVSISQTTTPFCSGSRQALDNRVFMAEPPRGANQLAGGSTTEEGRVWCSEGTLQGLEGQARWEVTNICWVPGTAV